MNLKRLLFTLSSLLIFANCFGYDLPDVITNDVYSDNIRTVQLYREGWALSSPVIVLNSDQKLAFNFDDLSAEVKNYYYTVYHCDRNWKISNIPQQEYLEPFTEFPLEDFEFSIVPLVRYVNYFLSLPNDNVKFRYSGNYAIVVYDKIHRRTSCAGGCMLLNH